MKKLLRRSGVFGVGLIWAAVWASPAVVIEGASNLGIDFPITSLFDIWPTVLAVPGLLGAVMFCAGLWSAEGERRLDETSIPRLGASGAVIGLLLGVLAAASGVANHAYPGLWPRALVIAGLTTLLGALSAVASALVFRYAAAEQSAALAGTRG